MKLYSLACTTMGSLAICFGLAASVSAGTVFATAEALLRGGVHADNDQPEDPIFGIFVKTSDNISFARKSYFQFDVTGEDFANEDATLSFGLILPIPHVIRTWALDQAYPGFTAEETWNGAQANDIDDVMLLETTGANTATALADTIIPLPITPGDTVSIPLGNLSAYVFDDVLTLALTGLDDLGDNGGLRIGPGSTNLTFGTVPEPTSLTLLGFVAIAFLVRVRVRCRA